MLGQAPTGPQGGPRYVTGKGRKARSSDGGAGQIDSETHGVAGQGPRVLAKSGGTHAARADRLPRHTRREGRQAPAPIDGYSSGTQAARADRLPRLSTDTPAAHKPRGPTAHEMRLLAAPHRVASRGPRGVDPRGQALRSVARVAWQELMHRHSPRRVLTPVTASRARLSSATASSPAPPACPRDSRRRAPCCPQ